MLTSRRLLVLLAGAGALSAPSALAAQQAPSDGQGAILALRGHAVRVVDKAHRVSDVHVKSTRGLHRGDVVHVRGGRARVLGHVRRLTFAGRVVRSSAKGAVVRLSDGSTFKVVGGRSHRRGGRRARSAANVTIDFQGLDPGQDVLITVATDGQGNVAITIRLLPAGTDVGDGELHAAGVVTDGEGDGRFAIRTDDGKGLRFDDPQGLLEAAHAAWCDVVDVTFHKHGHTLVADELQVTGSSDEGDCADAGDDLVDEVDGTVTALAADGSSLTVAPDDGTAAQTFPVDDPSLLDGIAVGDAVAVTLDEDGTAIDVEPLDASGDDPGAGDDGDDGE